MDKNDGELPYMNAEIVDEIVTLLREWPDNGKPPNSVVLQWAQFFRFVEEIDVRKLCSACGTPRHDYSYMKITPAGKAFLGLANRLAEPPSPSIQGDSNV